MEDKNQAQRLKSSLTRALKWAVIISLFGFTGINFEQNSTVAKAGNDAFAAMAFPKDIYNYEISVVGEKLRNADYISDRVGRIILTSMENASNKYRLPIMLMHAIFKVESDYRYWITHPTVRVEVNGRKITTNAIGLGGIMWCFWRDSLEANHIASKKSDLYMPDVNVMASGYILRTLIDDEAKNDPRITRANILDNVVRRYYGEYNKSYVEKMRRLTSRLWMKHIASLLMDDILKKNSTQQLAGIIK